MADQLLLDVLVDGLAELRHPDQLTELSRSEIVEALLGEVFLFDFLDNLLWHFTELLCHILLSIILESARDLSTSCAKPQWTKILQISQTSLAANSVTDIKAKPSSLN